MVNESIQAQIEALVASFGHSVSDVRLHHALETIAHYAYTEGKHAALSGLMSVDDVATELGVSRRRANAIIQNRHERFGMGMQIGKNTWIIHRDEMESLKPDEKHRKK